MENEFIPALEYIHLDSIGDIEKCKEQSVVISNWLEAEYKNNKIEGADVFIIRNKETIDEQIIFILYEKITNNSFPFLYVAVQTPKEYMNDMEKQLIHRGFSKAELPKN